MRNILFMSCLISLWICGNPVFALSEEVDRQIVQQNVLQLLENKSCQGCDLSGAKLERLDLTGVNLAEANLTGAKLNQTKLIRANLRNANLHDADFSGADLAGADLTGASMVGTVIAGANLAGTVLGGDVVVHSTSSEDVLLGKKEEPANNAEPEVKDVPDNEQQVSAAPLPPKSKQLSIINDAVVEPEETTQEKKEPEPTASLPLGATDKNPQDDSGQAEVSVPSSPMEDQADSAKDEELVIVEEMILPEEEQATQKPAEPETVQKDLTVPEEQIRQDMAAEDLKVTQVAETMPEPVVDPEAEQKKMLVEKLLDENRCVACDLAGVDLSDEDLEEADLERVILRGANLREVDLEEANLKGADLRETDLRDADLREADLYKADLSGADVTGAKFDEALIDSMIGIGVKGANYRDAIGEPITSPVLKQ